MDTVTLGRTGLRVSVVGLGCGGHSRLGQGTGRTEAESERVVRRALDLGVSYVDTAPAYGTEEIVGRALAHRRDEVALSTKATPRTERGLVTTGELRASLLASLRKLRCDFVDVFHLHGVLPEDHAYCRDALVPEMERMRDEGLLRFMGITERFTEDPGHRMLAGAVDDGCWDVMMVGFNLLNPSARRAVLPAAQTAGVGVEVMFAVRRLLTRPAELAQTVRRLADEGRVPSDQLEQDDPLGFLVRAGVAGSVVEAAYRFARHEPGCHVVLTGTGDTAHLEENVRAISGPPLPDAGRDRLRHLFGGVDHVTGD